MLNIFKKQWPTGEQFKCLLFASIVSSDYCARLVEGRFKHRDLKQQPSEAGIFWRLFKENLEFHPVVLWYLGSDYFKTTRWESFEVYLGQVVEGYTYFLGPFGDRLAEWTGMKGLEMDLLRYLHSPSSPWCVDYFLAKTEFSMLGILEEEIDGYYGTSFRKLASSAASTLEELDIRAKVYEFRVKKILEECGLKRQQGLKPEEVSTFTTLCIVVTNVLLDFALRMAGDGRTFVMQGGSENGETEWWATYWSGYLNVIGTSFEKHKGLLELRESLGI